jgi:hypothetical protein
VLVLAAEALDSVPGRSRRKWLHRGQGPVPLLWSCTTAFGLQLIVQEQLTLLNRPPMMLCCRRPRVAYRCGRRAGESE